MESGGNPEGILGESLEGFLGKSTWGIGNLLRESWENPLRDS